jgi:hypothetical protein
MAIPRGCGTGRSRWRSVAEMTRQRVDGASVVLSIGVPIGLVFGAVAVLRRSTPLHPKGMLRPGVLEITGSVESTGVPLLDTPDR